MDGLQNGTQRGRLAAVGGVAVSAPAANLIKETNFYFKSITD